VTGDPSNAPAGDAPLLDVRGLVVDYRRGRHQPPVRAVDDVDLSIRPRETLGLVGESGSGKTTIGRVILGLAPVGAGSVRLDGHDITDATHRERRRMSGDVQVVFQDPYSSLNPARTIGQTLAETLRVHIESQDEVDRQIRQILERVGLPAETTSRFPTQFSGGQRQRIAIARALIVEPRLIVCDEPVSALDLSVQANVLNLLRQLQREFDVSYLFISHDLSVVRHISHRIAVLYRGRVMEYGEAAAVYGRPAHPYTRALLAAAPVPDPHAQRQRRRRRRARSVEGAVPASTHSCPFAPRCPHAIDVCRSSRAPLEPTESGSLVACHRWRELQDEPRINGRPATAAL
jgi:oligopeptide/dipeptide ABC transporter ATP-binding protein